MQDAYAVRFRPPNHGRHVPACAYVEVLGFILEGLSSLRFAALARIANETGQPKDLVREALEFKIGPSIPGSLVVPIEAGAQDSLILGGDNVSNLFWRLAREALNSAATGTPSIEFSASGAEYFAKAARAGSEAGSVVELARVEEAKWTTWVDLSGIEAGLRTFAESRRVKHAGTAELVGQIVSLHKKPLGFALETSDGTKRISMTRALAAQAHRLWEQEVVVEVNASLDREGGVAEPKAVSIRAAKIAGSLHRDFKGTFGALSDVWGSPEAREYVDGLRRKN